MSQALSLSGFEIAVLYHEGSARVTVTRAGAPVFEAQVAAVHDVIPLRFTEGGKAFSALVSRSGRNAVLAGPGQPPVFAGSSPEFRKIAARVFVPGAHPGWALYTLARNLLAGLLFGFALVWGLVSSLDPVWIAALSLVGFAGSSAIDAARDRRVLEAVQKALDLGRDPETSP